MVRKKPERQYYVYMMSNVTGMLYIGVTNDIARRVIEHKSKKSRGFTSHYNLSQLVYCESTSDIYSALTREKQMKGWVRKKKVALIESLNPMWKDLSDDFVETENIT